MRVLYSFPHKIGAGQICTTAWHQVSAMVAAGIDVDLYTGSVLRRIPGVSDHKLTLGIRGFRIPYRLLGRKLACALHDMRVARAFSHGADRYAAIHAWPLGARRTLAAARKCGVPTFLERPNAHTRFAFEAVSKECARLGFVLPREHEHSYNASTLAIEEEEYNICSYLLCPSLFVEETFIHYGFKSNRLLRHQYGYDPKRYSVGEGNGESAPLRVIYAGGCAPRKGLHFALDAWFRSGLADSGEFLVCGGFVPGYKEILMSKLAHPSVKVLGHRTDLPELMAKSDILVLSSIEEGSALVTYEARGSGCVLCVSSASGAVVDHGRTGLVHPTGDSEMLASHFAVLNRDRGYLSRLRKNSIREIGGLTWESAGKRLAEIYREKGRWSPATPSA